MWPGRNRTSDAMRLSCNVYIRMKKNWVLSYPLSALRSAKTLIRLGRCPGWSESSLGTKAILLVLSWGGSHSESASLFSLVASEINHTFEGRALYRSRQWVWLQSQGSLVRAPTLPQTGNTCNLRRISHEIMYMVFLLFPLIQERQFLVISESICTLDHFVLVNRLEGLSLSARRSGVGRSFNCIPGNHRPRISQSDLLLHARDSRNPKPILA